MRKLVGFLAALAILAAGCGGTEGPGAGASDLVPASAVAFIAIDSDPRSEQWQLVNELASRFPDKQKGINELKRDLREEEGIDWERDVKPALGDETAVVWLDFEQDGENFVGLMRPKSEAKFEQLIAKGNAKDPDEKVVYGTFRGWKVLADKQATIDRFIRESQAAGRTLSDDATFKRSMESLGGDALVRAYINGKTIMQLARRYGGPELRPFINKAGTLDWIAMKLGVTPEGVGFDAIVHGTPGELFKGLPRTDPFNAKLTKTVPQNVLLYWTFHGSKNMLSGLRKNPFFDTPELRPYGDVLDEIGRLLQGENAFYVRPGEGRLPSVPFAIPEATFIAAPGGGTNGAEIVDRLIERELGVGPDRTRIAGIPVRKIGSDEVAGYYANVDGKLVITDLPSGIRGVKNPGKTLAESDAYRDAAEASGLPDKTQGFFYVNVRSSIPFGETLAQQRIPGEISRNLKPLRSAVEYAVSRSHELQITFFLRIK
jgi:hypothetical protein